MARNFVAASTQFLENGNGIVTTPPLTIVGWYKPATLSDAVIASVSNNSSANFFLIELRISGAAQAFEYDGTNSGFAASGSTISAGSWTHFGAVFTSHSNRTVYLNGVGTNDTLSGTPAPTGINRTNVGVTYSGASGLNYANGDIAEVAYWNVALDASEMAALAKGVCPLLIRPTSLVAYYPLFGNDTTEIDRWKNRYDLTNHSTTKSNHPRVYYPSTSGRVRSKFGSIFTSTLSATSTTSANIVISLIRILSLTAQSVTSAKLVKFITKSISASSTIAATVTLNYLYAVRKYIRSLTRSLQGRRITSPLSGLNRTTKQVEP